MNNIIIFPWLYDLTKIQLVNFYGYTSRIDKRIIVVDWSSQVNDELQYQIDWFKRFKEYVLENNPELRWDNKIVIECKVGNTTIFVSYYDFIYSVGLELRSSESTPIKLNNETKTN